MDDVRKKWKRKLPYRIYDYNYKIGESYYTPQTNYIENRELLRSRVEPPKAGTFAERFAERPVYGGTRGLPYGQDDSALSQPLVSRRRSSSASRGGSRERELDDLPPPTRSGRGRERTLSFTQDHPEPEPRRKFSLADDLDFKDPVKKYIDSSYGFRSSLDRDQLKNDLPSINPSAKQHIQDDIKKLEKQFKKADQLERGSGSKSWTEVVWNDELEAPGKKTVKKDFTSYSIPGSGTSVKKSSYQESSKFEPSRPPRAPMKPSRLLSLEDDPDFKRPSSSVRSSIRRRRHASFSDDNTPSRSSFKSIMDDEDQKFGSAKKMFDHRRAKESEELTDNVNKMLSRMRKHSIGDSRDGLTYSRTVRSSSLDPYDGSELVRASSRRSHKFSYGVAK